MSTTRRLLLIAHLPILLGWIVLASIAYDALPDRIPTHFDASGTADGFMNRSIMSWFLLPLVGVISALTIVLLGIISERYPQFMNVPNKSAFVALSNEQRRPLTDMLGTFMAAISLAVTIFLAALHYDTWRVARGHVAGLSWLSMAAFGLMLAFTIGGSIIFAIRFNRLVKGLQATATVRTA